ncbi:putative F-box domain, kelch-type beta propeller, F-box-like domain superfamily [Helianthus annuus]|uniref:F-box domain, kelch-type beta propeller, F-box-like domain superfamily n=1 Tax=Helianthus annuus TaxID=4232 RepID=A0A251U3D4_HELAN|nr:F-box/kelch-repeat protein At1g80440 [Helianthus annuus]KAF5793240.1 putative F-box domain, kelch-type beta propeller, F-box-like domain superfamily [Helianthus annuus]KAJ0528076.1 putative F-box/kelch-repeat protein KMD1/2 [Helianthus annuus]KAJ0544512.1 putative F-box/kelch-repeat protein KMD1/2 [Helianthus annuus]KAJ0709514.1 putative F-box/kelch-repeat protein KMD1/2 [Helianthus annuus]KAJ0713389.1 putative F-box/kelch-repeat protein KMD1/2 [Helianthus annuus]
MELIPGLPNDIGLECLTRLPHTAFSAAASVCRSWKSQISHPSFRNHRKSAGLTRRIVVMVQSQVDPNRKHGLRKYSAAPVYRLTVFEPETGNWTELPPIPGFSDGLPLFCQVAPVGFNLVVMGGLNPDNWEAGNFVFVFNFLSATWRRGPDMPGCTRSFFGCASDNERRVFVAGGHDNEKNALRSGMVYDMAEDDWTLLPDMADERDECKGVFHCGKFYVIGGYNTLMQGQFGKSAEGFDPVTWRWGPTEGEFLGDDTCPRTCVDGGNGAMYMYQDGAVVALDRSSRTRIPSEMDSVPCLIECGGRLLAVGSVGFGRSHGVYVLDLESATWVKADVREEYSGHVQSGCCLEV